MTDTPKHFNARQRELLARQASQPEIESYQRLAQSESAAERAERMLREAPLAANDSPFYRAVSDLRLPKPWYVRLTRYVKRLLLYPS